MTHRFELRRASPVHMLGSAWDVYEVRGEELIYRPELSGRGQDAVALRLRREYPGCRIRIGKAHKRKADVIQYADTG